MTTMVKGTEDNIAFAFLTTEDSIAFWQQKIIYYINININIAFAFVTTFLVDMTIIYIN